MEVLTGLSAGYLAISDPRLSPYYLDSVPGTNMMFFGAIFIGLSLAFFTLFFIYEYLKISNNKNTILL